ncbi:MAG: HIT family protein [bacterium]|nr:HIT family protein [bacterium]
MNDCIFCKILNKEIPAEILFEDDETIAFLDIRPISKGHTLVIPKEHSTDFNDTSREYLMAITQTVKIVSRAIMKALGASGFNIGVNNGESAGQVIFHAHWHVIPRFDRDGLVPWPEKEYGDGEISIIAEKIRAQF